MVELKSFNAVLININRGFMTHENGHDRFPPKIYLSLFPQKKRTRDIVRKICNNNNEGINFITILMIYNDI